VCLSVGCGDARPLATSIRSKKQESSMNFHEYQAKDLFAAYGIPVPRGELATTADEAVEAAGKVGGTQWVVKAQVHAGGRGKAGGVKLANSLDEVRRMPRHARHGHRDLPDRRPRAAVSSAC
jgi:acyl-CoA synthetase (NDP forming)